MADGGKAIPRCVLEARAALGEGPVWCPAEGALYWVDSMAPSLNRFDPETGARRCWIVPDLIGSFALRRNGGALLALRHGLAALDFESGAVRHLKDLAAAERDNRFNDGKCDRRGRFWAGTMHFAGLPRAARGRLYRFEPDLSHAVRETGIRTSNGIGWSPDDRTMYYTDTRVSRIHAYDYDIETGENTGRRDFVVVPEETGYPDGLTVDSAGYVWSANWGGGRIVRYAPDGEIDRVVATPVSRPTSLTMGGPDLRTLFITSAREGLSAAALAGEALAGGIFALDVDVPGLPEARFAG
jgi:L-arabinonolactonase